MAHESISLDVNKANGRLTSNAKGIFCDNVRCFATNKSCSNRTLLQECFECSSFFACTVFNLFSYLPFPHTPCSFPVPVSCRLLLKHFGPTSWNSHWNELACRGISPTYQVRYLLISALWTHESTSLDVNLSLVDTSKP